MPPHDPPPPPRLRRGGRVRHFISFFFNLFAPFPRIFPPSRSRAAPLGVFSFSPRSGGRGRPTPTGNDVTTTCGGEGRPGGPQMCNAGVGGPESDAPPTSQPPTQGLGGTRGSRNRGTQNWGWEFPLPREGPIAGGGTPNVGGPIAGGGPQQGPQNGGSPKIGGGACFPGGALLVGVPGGPKNPREGATKKGVHPRVGVPKTGALMIVPILGGPLGGGKAHGGGLRQMQFWSI